MFPCLTSCCQNLEERLTEKESLLVRSCFWSFGSETQNQSKTPCQTAGFTHSLVKPTSLQRYHRLKPNAVNHRNEISLMSWLFLQRESWIISHVSPLEFSEESQQCFKLCPDLQSALNDLSCSTDSFYCLLDEKWFILGFFFLTQFT